MTLTKNKMIREIGRRTRLRNRDVQKMLETLIDVWTEELVSGGRIEIENFIVMEIQQVDRGLNCGTLFQRGEYRHAPRFVNKLAARMSKSLKAKITSDTTQDECTRTTKKAR